MVLVYDEPLVAALLKTHRQPKVKFGGCAVFSSVQTFSVRGGERQMRTQSRIATAHAGTIAHVDRGARSDAAS
jgi:hypothetical protein